MEPMSFEAGFGGQLQQLRMRRVPAEKTEWSGTMTTLYQAEFEILAEALEALRKAARGLIFDEP